MLEHVHIKIDAGLKRRAEEAADKLELRNLSAFIRMALAEKVNAVLGEDLTRALPIHVATKDKH